MEDEFPRGLVTVLVAEADGVGRLKAREGAAVAQEALRLVEETVLRLVEDHGGRGAAFSAWGWTVAFSSPRQAIGCAVAVQRAAAWLGRERPTWHLGVRMGLDIGEAYLEDGRLAGEAMEAAGRLAARAAGGQVLATPAVKELA